MSVKQLSVFVENRAGRLSAITRMLGENGINIRAMSVADTKDFGILRLIVNDAEKALETLKKNDCSVTITNVLAIEISDKPCGLATAMDILYKENISVEYMYAAFINSANETAYLILRVDNNELATTAFEDNGYHLLDETELGKI